MRSEELALKRRGNSSFLRLILLNKHVLGVSLSDAKIMGGEYYNKSRNAIY